MPRSSRTGNASQSIDIRSTLTRGAQRLAATLLFILVAALPGLAQVRLTLKGHTLALASIAYSPDGKFVATGSYDGTAKVWDTDTGKEVITLNGHTGTVEAVAFSRDGKTLATGS
jgi:WD40 repeat protein